MKTTLKWKQKSFSQTCEIYSGNNLVGRIKENSWNQTADGDINGKKYIYKTRGFIKPQTQILDGSNKIIGSITYNSWMTKARIKTPAGIATMNCDNSFNTKWSLHDDAKIPILYSCSASNGLINTENQNDFLTLTGLYITRYSRRMMFVVFIAVFIPLFTSMIRLWANN